MDAREYFEEVVLPLAAELAKRRDDRAIIMASAIVTFQVVDWIAKERNEGRDVARARVTSRFPDFKYLRAVATAHKHMEVNNPPEFRGLINPLTPVEPPGFLLAENGDRLLAETGDALLNEGKLPEYVFVDGQKRDPATLIEGAIEAIMAEFK